jgi:ACT domain-containing protein
MERINRNHNLPAALKKYRDIDKYHVQLGRESLPSQGLDSGDNQLSFNTEMAVGGVDIFASQNFQYNQVIPQFNTLTPSDETTIETQIRTVSGTSASGNEISFVDQGYENITLNRPNRLETPRIVCSEINEVTRLTTMPKNKSVTLGVQFNTEDTNLSPVLDVMNGTIVYERSRLNSPINNYAKDAGSDNPSGDPHAAVYITKKVDLKNPATSLKVMVAAYRHSTSDFRMLYQLFKEDSTDTEESWELFPGYNNLNVVGSMGDRVINPANNDGRPDRFIPASDEGQFLEYQFTSDSLTEFTGFRIKMVSSGTNEAYAPKFKDFRVIALA